jgi:multidrug resistance efflux pump
MTEHRLRSFFTWCLVLAALALCGAGLAGLRLVGAGERSSSRPDGSTAGDVDNSEVDCLGYVDVEGGVVSLTPTQAGRVLEVPAKEGEFVQKGAVLARLDDATARFNAEQAETALKLAQTQLDQADVNRKQFPSRLTQQRAARDAAASRLATAKLLLTHQRKLRETNLVSETDVAIALEHVNEMEALERAEAGRLKELELSDPDLMVREVEQKVATAQTGLRHANYILEQYTLKAPQAGTVLRVAVSVGELAGGDKPAIVFFPDRPLIVRVDVEQEFAGRIAVGRSAKVEDELDAETVWGGRVTRIAEWYTQRRSILARPGQFKDVPTVECVIALDEGRPPFRLGQRVQVRIKK